MIARSVFFASVFALGLAAASSLQAQPPGRRQSPRVVLLALDLDRDGTLSAAEIKAAPTSLLTLDRNGDGMITPDELSERPENAGASADELTQQLMAFDKTGKGYLVSSDLPERMQGVFSRGDANHNGKLTPEEIRALSARQGMPNGPATAPGRAGGNFRQDPLLFALDLNHDGMIEANEIAAAGTSLLTLDKNGDGQITPDEMRIREQTAEDRVDHMLEEFDTNKDGKLSRAEVPEGMARQFDSIDTNHDGYLDRSELVVSMQKQGNNPPRRDNQGPPPPSAQQPQ